MSPRGPDQPIAALSAACPSRAPIAGSLSHVSGRGTERSLVVVLNGQDVVVLLKLAGHGEDWTVRSLEADLGVSRAGVHRSLQRLSAAGLYDLQRRRVNISRAEERERRRAIAARDAEILARSGIDAD